MADAVEGPQIFEVGGKLERSVAGCKSLRYRSRAGPRLFDRQARDGVGQ
jgi:hypothetical protein